VKIIDKLFILPILMAVILTSCDGSVSTPAMSPTEVMVTTIAPVEPTFTEITLVIPPATLTAMPFPTSTFIPTLEVPFFTFTVDRHDPESVIRAYFDAWERSDSLAMASVLSSKYGRSFMFEPMVSLEILEIELISDASPTERSYSVLYDVQWKNREDTNPTRWSFHLTWDANRDSWTITNYGAG
jgi:hypothetical protein